MRNASKSYFLNFGGAMLLYSIMLPVAILLLQRARTSPLSILIALAMLIPIWLAMRAFRRFFQAMDELQRKIQLEALATAFAGTALISFAYGLLATAGYPQLSWVWVLPLMTTLWGIAVAVASRKYA